jgi:hypothetical protein
MAPKVPNGYKAASPGILVILVCFFLPWVLQSCGNTPPQEYSGWQLALGDPAAGPGYHGNPLIFLIPIVALFIAFLAFRAIRRAALSRWDGYLPTGLSALILLFLFSQFGGPVAEGSTRQILYGLWGEVVGWVLVLAGGVLNLIEGRQPPNKT